MKKIVSEIALACNCDERKAEEYLEAEMRNLADLFRAGDLRYEDLKNACSAVGLEVDDVECFLRVLANSI